MNLLLPILFRSATQLKHCRCQSKVSEILRKDEQKLDFAFSENLGKAAFGYIRIILSKIYNIVRHFRSLVNCTNSKL